MNGNIMENRVEAGKEGNQFLDAVYWQLIVSGLHHRSFMISYYSYFIILASAGMGWLANLDSAADQLIFLKKASI